MRNPPRTRTPADLSDRPERHWSRTRDGIGQPDVPVRKLLGLLPPSRHHPDQAALNSTPSLRRGRRRRSPTSARITAASRSKPKIEQSLWRTRSQCAFMRGARGAVCRMSLCRLGRPRRAQLWGASWRCSPVIWCRNTRTLLCLDRSSPAGAAGRTRSPHQGRSTATTQLVILPR
jgi:hypothetical protein